MPRFRIPACSLALAAAAIVFTSAHSAGDTSYQLASREVVESRLRQYGGENPQREATLKNLFTAVGCDPGQKLAKPPFHCRPSF